jgi:hypothetical protein
MKRTAVVVGSFLVLTAGGCSAHHAGACYAQSDKAAFEEVRHQRPYPEITRARLLGVGRLEDTKNEDESEISFWFLVDKNSGTATNVKLFGDCDTQVSGGSVQSMKAAAPDVSPPQF